MKKQLFILTLLVLNSVVSFGLTFTVDKISYKTLTDSTVTVTGFTLSMINLEIPSKVTYKDIEYNVKEISEKGLYGYKSGTSSSMETLTISEGIEKIGKEAVTSNKKLKSVSLPSTLVEIGESSFYNLTSLQSVEFPNGSNLIVISNKAFRDCEKLEDFEIPSSVNVIGQLAFASCKKLFSVTIPQNVTVIQEYTFQNCKDLHIVELHNNINRVEKSAFNGCSALEIIDTKIIENLKYIGGSAFSGIPGIKHLTLNGGLDTINVTAFSSCKELEYVWLREGITTISKMAFANCTKLKYVVLPSTLEKVGSGAFGESNERLLDYVPHNPRTFIFLADIPFAIEYSATTDGLNDAFPSLGKIVKEDCFYVKESAVNEYKKKWGSGYYHNIDYKIPFKSEMSYSTNCREFDTDYHVTATNGNLPFVATDFAEECVMFTSIVDGIVPALTPVLIHKESDENTWFQIAEQQGAQFSMTNYLKGVTYADEIAPVSEEGRFNYVLKNDAFCRLNTSVVIDDHNAYLQLPTTMADELSIVFTGLKGDVNNDGTVDVADISAIIDVMAGSGLEFRSRADVNEDGTVDVADIAEVIDIMAAL